MSGCRGGKLMVTLSGRKRTSTSQASSTRMVGDREADRATPIREPRRGRKVARICGNQKSWCLLFACDRIQSTLERPKATCELHREQLDWTQENFLDNHEAVGLLYGSL